MTVGLDNRSRQVARAKRFSDALSRGYAEYQWKLEKSKQPSRGQKVARKLGDVGCLSYIAALPLIFPLVSVPFWSDEFRRAYGMVPVWLFAGLMSVSLICLAGCFVIGIWRAIRDYYRE
jgi:hypothetical protein